jgi:hypothetical protein
MIRAYMESAFHIPPTPAWLPQLSWPAGLVLILGRHLAAWALLLGVVPRTAAAFLAASGFYVVLLDPHHHSHNAHFHLVLLALLACSPDRVSIRGLCREDAAQARTVAWPERLIRLQVAIVYFYAAVDKVFNPFWGVSGTVLAELDMASHGPPLRWLQRINALVLHRVPGLMSVATIAAEFLLSATFLFQRLRPLAVPVGFLFAVYLEFLLRPDMFAWDMVSTLVLLLPAADRGWTLRYDERCAACRAKRRWIARLDWLRRLRWEVATASQPADRGPSAPALISPSGQAFHGFEEFRRLVLLLPAPLFVLFAVIRFGVGSPVLGLVAPHDLVLLLVGVIVALWLPGVSRPLRGGLEPALSAVRNRLGSAADATDLCVRHRPERVDSRAAERSGRLR